MTKYLCLMPRDPVIARDSRPFGAGMRMRSVDWIFPSVVAGALRTAIGKSKSGVFDGELIESLKTLEVAGPLPMVENVLFVPKPDDCLVSDTREVLAVRPQEYQADEGTDLPSDSLRPVVLPNSVESDFKPQPTPAWWALQNIEKWLLSPRGVDSFSVPTAQEVTDAVKHNGFLNTATTEERTHVKIDPVSRTAQDTQLFSTIGLALDGRTKWNLGIRVQGEESFAEELNKIDGLHPLGGERRLVRWREDGNDLATSWRCPDLIRDTLNESQRIRMLVVTPAIFTSGWRPGWLEQQSEGLVGCPPGARVKLRLVGATCSRWRPVSGFDYEKRKPKSIRRMVPAGAVYFFEKVEGDCGDLAKLWLESVCDDPQTRRDGFGLAAWGTWDYHR